MVHLKKEKMPFYHIASRYVNCQVFEFAVKLFYGKQF